MNVFRALQGVIASAEKNEIVVFRVFRKRFLHQEQDSFDAGKFSPIDRNALFCEEDIGPVDRPELFDVTLLINMDKECTVVRRQFVDDPLEKSGVFIGKHEIGNFHERFTWFILSACIGICMAG